MDISGLNYQDADADHLSPETRMSKFLSNIGGSVKSIQEKVTQRQPEKASLRNPVAFIEKVYGHTRAEVIGKRRNSISF